MIHLACVLYCMKCFYGDSVKRKCIFDRRASLECSRSFDVFAYKSDALDSASKNQ